MPKYQAHTGERSYAIEATALDRIDLQATAPGHYHLLHEGQAYRVEVLGIERNQKRVHLRINGREVSYDLRDETDQAIDALGFATAETVVNKDVLAPMPGLVLDILVEEGAEVTAGTPLIILEAMKMENVLKAESDGTVERLEVKKGEAVDKRQLLIKVA